MQIFSQLFSFFNQNAYYCQIYDELWAGGFFLSYTHIEARKRGNLSPGYGVWVMGYDLSMHAPPYIRQKKGKIYHLKGKFFYFFLHFLCKRV